MFCRNVAPPLPAVPIFLLLAPPVARSRKSLAHVPVLSGACRAGSPFLRRSAALPDPQACRQKESLTLRETGNGRAPPAHGLPVRTTPSGHAGTAATRCLA